MKTIPLTRGYVAWVDDEDYELLAHHRWRTQFGRGDGAYAVRGMGILMHRVILNAAAGAQVDHRAHHPSDRIVDNRSSNLRLASANEQMRNRGKFERARGYTSVFKGVRWDRERGKWRVQVTVEKRAVCLGRFGIEVLAALAYDVEAVRLFGEFAVTNFPVPGSPRWLFDSGA